MEKGGPSRTSEVKVKGPKKKVVVASQQGSTTKEGNSVQRKVSSAISMKQLARSRGNNVKVKAPLVEPSQTTPQVVVRGEKKTVYIDVGLGISPHIDEECNYIRPTHIIYKNYMHYLPHFIHEYVKSTDDVSGDGNCGYHVFLDQLGSFADDARSWKVEQITYVREKCLLELRCSPDFYKRMMRFERDEAGAVLKERFEAFERRLKVNTKLTSEYWMRIPICGYRLANAFHCVIHSISYADSATYAPTRSTFTDDESTRIVTMGFVSMSHFIGLQLKEESLLPPLRRGDGGDNEISLGWCARFEERFELWKALKLSRDAPCILMTSDEDDYETSNDDDYE
ncbi:uncharacterized protein LOC113279735 [Papaver somniferum]|uniref:uncharacterized protein LOC113279735 n=1 Tax=Papaver somniferum TaxID=3469 RepID=UPI000E6F9A4C|nr:uncharacterized protein LOC113279735 [Papaver somniferum]